MSHSSAAISAAARCSLVEAMLRATHAQDHHSTHAAAGDACCNAGPVRQTRGFR
jgi:hypothetical protein